MREIVVTIEAPPDVSVRVIRKEAPSKLRLAPRGKVGKPVRAFRDAFAATSEDGGAVAQAEAVREHFSTNYQTSGRNPKEAVERAWRRALSLVEDDYRVEYRGGLEIFKRIDPAEAKHPPSPSPAGKSAHHPLSISAARGARTG